MPSSPLHISSREIFGQSYGQTSLPRTERSSTVSHLSPSPGLLSKRRGYERRSCARITHRLVCPTTISDMPSCQKGVANPLKTCSRKRKGDAMMKQREDLVNHVGNQFVVPQSCVTLAYPISWELRILIVKTMFKTKKFRQSQLVPNVILCPGQS